MPPETQAVDEAQAKADAQAAFEESSADAKPAKEAKPDPKPEPKAEPKAEKSDEVKPNPKAVEEAVAKSQREAAAKAATEKEWEGVPAKVRQMLEGISGKVGTIDELAHIVKSQDGRVGAALAGVKALTAAVDAAKAATKAGGDAPTQDQIAAAARSSAKWKQAKEDYPDWAEAMEERFAALPFALPPKGTDATVDVAALKAEVTGTVGEIVAKATSEAKAEARELAKIDRTHEDWEQTINTQEFADWRKAQAPDIQALAASDKSADAIKMLDAYEKHRKAVADATVKAEADRKRLGGAIQPKGTAAPAARNMSDEAAAQQGFNSAFT
jgi:hypothetical protein